MFSRLILGIKRDPKRFGMFFLFSYSWCWIVIEPILGIGISESFSGGWYFYLFFLLVSLIVASLLTWPKDFIKLRLGASNTEIEILFGDLFNFDSFIAIPVSQFFEYEVDLLVSQRSLHAQVINRFFPDELDLYAERIISSLDGEPYKTVRNRRRGEEKKYKFGTTVQIKKDNNNFILFALTKTELKSKVTKNNSDVTILWKTLMRFWNKTRNIANGEIINIPLIGSGVSGIGLPPMRLLELNLLAILESTKKGGFITNKIRVVIKNDHFDMIDLIALKKTWNSKYS